MTLCDDLTRVIDAIGQLICRGDESGIPGLLERLEDVATNVGRAWSGSRKRIVTNSAT